MPNKNINFRVFLAGSTESQMLKDAKDCTMRNLRVEQIYDYAKDYDCELKVIDCKDPSKDGKQKEYNHAIEEESDVFVLMIDKVPVGPYSMEELMRACMSQSNSSHPDVYVFYNKTIEKDPYISDLANVVKSFTGRFSDAFDSPEDLSRKIISIIKRKVRLKQEKHLANEAEKRTRQREELQQARNTARRKVLKNIVSALLFLGLLTLAYLIPQLTKPGTILFAGGGSVLEFLKAKNMDLEKRTDDVYVHLPTGNAWIVLGEESKVNDSIKKKYYPIVLAADKIKENQEGLKVDTAQFVAKTGRIAEFWLGYDPLLVTVPKDADMGNLKKYLQHADEGYISIDELYNVIVNHDTDGITIYHTSAQSGTLEKYRSALDEYLAASNIEWTWAIDDQNGYEEYVSSDNISSISNRTFIILGSQYYHMTGQHGTTRQLYVKQDGQNLRKDLYLYFVLKKSKDYQYSLERPIKRFLKELVAQKVVSPDTVVIQDEYVIQNSDPRFVIPFKELKR